MRSPFIAQGIPTELRAQWAHNLERARKRAGYRTQRDFAAALGCTRQAVTQWEAGRAAPNRASRQRIAEVLGKEVTRLFPHAA